MGYRSDIAIKCREDAYKRLKETADKHEIWPDKVFKEGEQQNREFIMFWENTKWDSSFEEVNALMAEMAKLNNEHQDGDRLSYTFVRIGNDIDDIERLTNDYSLKMGIIRQIILPDEDKLVEPD